MKTGMKYIIDLTTGVLRLHESAAAQCITDVQLLTHLSSSPSDSFPPSSPSIELYAPVAAAEHGDIAVQHMQW